MTDTGMNYEASMNLFRTMYKRKIQDVDTADFSIITFEFLSGGGKYINLFK